MFSSSEGAPAGLWEVLLRKTAVSGAMSGSRAEDTCFTPASVPTAAGVEKRRLGLDRQSTTIENILRQEIYQLLVAGDLRCLPWATQMHTRSTCTESPRGPWGTEGVWRVMTVRPVRYNKKQRGTVLGSEATSLSPCHMSCNPPRPTPLSHRSRTQLAELYWPRGCFAIRGAPRGLSSFLCFSNKALFSLPPIG